MQINWIELRHKKTGLTLKKTTLTKRVCLSSESPEALRFVLDAVSGAAAFAQGQTQPGFLDVICRLSFNASHQEYLWYAKNTAAEDGQTIVDEEELYDHDNQMLLRRSFTEMTYEGYNALPQINLERSMLYLFAPNPLITDITAAFGHLYQYTASADTAETIAGDLAQLPHGAAALIDASSLAAPLDLTAISQSRPDLQLITSNCLLTDAASMTITQSGKMISCK